MSSTTVASRAYAVVPAKRSRWSRGGAYRPRSAPAAGSARHRADAGRRDRAARSPDRQPASCRRSFRRGYRARAAPSTRHHWRPRPDRQPVPGCVGRDVLAGACVPTSGPAGAVPVRVRSRSSAGLRWRRGRLWHPRRQHRPLRTGPGSGDRCEGRRFAPLARRIYVPGILSSQPSQVCPPAHGTVPERRANVQKGARPRGTDRRYSVPFRGSAGRRNDAGTRWLGCCPPEMSTGETHPRAKRPMNRAKTPLRRRAAPIVLACNASTSLGIGERAKLIIGDEPAAWVGANGRGLWESLTTSLGKDGVDARLFLIGTRYPADPTHWWQTVIDGGDTATRRVFHITGDARQWKSWREVQRCNPMVKQSQVFAAQLRAEHTDAKKSAPARFTFQRIRLNARMHGKTADSVLIQPSAVDTLLARPPAPRAGACIVAIDMGGATGWSGGTAVWESGRIECFAVCPQTAEAMEVQDGRDTGDYRALADLGVLVESGVNVPSGDLIAGEIRQRWPEALCIIGDIYRLPQLQEAFDGELPIHLRKWKWAEQTQDVTTFRRLATDGPPLLSLADDGTREIFTVSLSETIVEGDSLGNVRVSKMRGDRRSRNDVISAAVMATWGLTSHISMLA